MYGLDFETYGTRDLRTVGIDNYMADPEFKPLIAAVVHNTGVEEMYDFVLEPDCIYDFADTLRQNAGVAHNAPFERGVLTTMKVDPDIGAYLRDTAMLARAMGAGASLSHAARQLLDSDKLDEGKELIQKFSLPTKDGRCLVDDLAAAGTLHKDPDWARFKEYCLQDARLSVDLWETYSPNLNGKELRFEKLTHEMNQAGWRVDLAAVQEMSRRYHENLEVELAQFRLTYDPKHELNFGSPIQLKRWCAERGVKASSFDEAHVAALLKKMEQKLDTLPVSDSRYVGYNEVRAMLRTKQALGGSSLKKLKVIMAMVSADGRLRNQYMHLGAGQTFRTSGRGVQMQNLKRLRVPADMEELYEDDLHWTNDELAENLRQVFTATDEQGALIVGDFASVESRGLAILAGARWKVEAFHQGKDMYKVLAQEIYHIDYDAVTKGERQTGKVGELSCGYGAGPVAVQTFAAGMGVTMSEQDATSLVTNWRGVNPEIVDLWGVLDNMLHAFVQSKGQTQNHTLAMGWTIKMHSPVTPRSLTRQHPGARSMLISLITDQGATYLQRVFHGLYMRGRSICFYKPSQLANGDAWSPFYTDPKTKLRKYYSIYGGKLTGILTQSLCREIFFDSLTAVDRAVGPEHGLTLVGQFHDEIVVDYNPRQSSITLAEAQRKITEAMQVCVVPNFPLVAEVKADYRYIK